MGFLDSITNMAAQKLQGDTSKGTSASVAGGLMEALEEHPGGLNSILQNFQQNGMGQHVEGWANGQQATATPEQVQQGMQGTGLIDNIAAKAGVSPEIAKIALAAMLPIVISHFTKGGEKEAPSSGFGGMASQILAKFL
jgi:uncharacterized protein YidB (DUF937 family)